MSTRELAFLGCVPTTKYGIFIYSSSKLVSISSSELASVDSLSSSLNNVSQVSSKTISEKRSNISLASLGSTCQILMISSAVLISSDILKEKPSKLYLGTK